MRTHGGLNEDSPPEGKGSGSGREGNGKEGNGKEGDRKGGDRGGEPTMSAPYRRPPVDSSTVPEKPGRSTSPLLSLNNGKGNGGTRTASRKGNPGNSGFENFTNSLSLTKKAALLHARNLSSDGDNEMAIRHLKAARFAGRELQRAIELLPGRMAN